MNVTDKYVLFWGSIFSDFANTPYTSHDGINFFCTEQEFMYRKATLFEDEETARKALLSYPGKTFVEASPFDTIWGIGLSEADYRAIDPTQWRGKNLLGQILARLRDELQ